MDFSYNFDSDPAAGVQNNGNVGAIANNITAARSQSFTYDELNRLKAMASTGTSCTALEWTYDIWANRTNQNIGQGGAACGTHHPTINSKNQIVDTGYVYDAAGNMTQEPGKTYQYDAEGRLKSLNALCYTYDANGRRVRKIASGVTTEYIYGAGGVVAEKVGTTWTVGYVYLNGQLLAQYKNGTTYFAHKDHLGSTRLLTKPDGNHDSGDVYDFLPYGEPVGSQSTTTSHKFTGHERDAESGLDYFGARYLSSTYGRFQSPDEGPLREQDPQSLNRYTYVRNNPIVLIDEFGHYWVEATQPIKGTTAYRIYRHTQNFKLPRIPGVLRRILGRAAGVAGAADQLSRDHTGDTNRLQTFWERLSGRFTFEVDKKRGFDPFKYSIGEGIALDERVFGAFVKEFKKEDMLDSKPGSNVEWLTVWSAAEVREFEMFHTAYRYAEEIKRLEEALGKAETEEERQKLLDEIRKREDTDEYRKYGAAAKKHLD